jgi:hypothetical protein
MATRLGIVGLLSVSSGVGDSWSATCNNCIQEKEHIAFQIPFYKSKLLCISTITYMYYMHLHAENEKVMMI